MPKGDPIGVRLDRAERNALERAAKADDRGMSSLARKYITEALKKDGWLEPERASADLK